MNIYSSAALKNIVAQAADESASMPAIKPRIRSSSGFKYPLPLENTKAKNAAMGKNRIFTPKELEIQPGIWHAQLGE
jgi:hypothetical protein